MALLNWFDRTFDFSVPPGLFGPILERLRGTPGRLVERTSGVPTDLLVRRAGTHWSIQEHAGHLLDLETLWHVRARQLFAGEAELEAADLTNQATEAAHHNTRPLDDILRAFEHARARFLARIAEADDDTIVRSALHPRLRTPMRLIDLALFVAEHDDHHLASITRLRHPLDHPGETDADDTR